MRNVFVILASVTLLVVSVSAWPASTREEIKALNEKVAEIQKDLAEIKKMLQTGAGVPVPPNNVTVFKEQALSVASSPFKGQIDAAVTLVEFSDYECPYCARHHREVMPVLEAEYIDTGRLKFVMRENPIPRLHRNAMNASLAALCAKDQDKYWDMHDALFDNQRELGGDKLSILAAGIGLDPAEFGQCMETKKFQEQIMSDIASGARLGVRGTPAFVLGLTDPEDQGKANVTIFIKGAQPLASFRQAIDDLLESAE
jgi:protein-disulfide isomerase